MIQRNIHHKSKNNLVFPIFQNQNIISAALKTKKIINNWVTPLVR